MKFFKRNNSDAAAVPEDLQPYYNNSNGGVRRWLGPIARAALLLGALVLLVWGGLALVNRFTNNDSGDQARNQGAGQDIAQAPNDNTPTPEAGTTVQPSPTPAPTPRPSTPTPKPTPAPTPRPSATPTPRPTPAPRPAATATPAPTPAPARTATPAPAPAPTQAPTAVATTGEPDRLVNSGPGEVALVLFGAVSIFGTLLHRAVALRRS